MRFKFKLYSSFQNIFSPQELLFGIYCLRIGWQIVDLIIYVKFILLYSEYEVYGNDCLRNEKREYSVKFCSRLSVSWLAPSGKWQHTQLLSLYSSGRVVARLECQVMFGRVVARLDCQFMLGRVIASPSLYPSGRVVARPKFQSLSRCEVARPECQTMLGRVVARPEYQSLSRSVVSHPIRACMQHLDGSPLQVIYYVRCSTSGRVVARLHFVRPGQPVYEVCVVWSAVPSRSFLVSLSYSERWVAHPDCQYIHSQERDNTLKHRMTWVAGVQTMCCRVAVPLDFSSVMCLVNFFSLQTPSR